MKQIVALCIFFLGVSTFQTPATPQEAYPGQSTHAHPPDDFFCRDTPKPGEHECHCTRMTGETKGDPLCEEEPDPRECEVWCYAKAHFVPDEKKRMDPITGQRGGWHNSHCRCPIHCDVPGHVMPSVETSAISPIR